MSTSELFEDLKQSQHGVDQDEIDALCENGDGDGGNMRRSDSGVAAALAAMTGADMPEPDLSQEPGYDAYQRGLQNIEVQHDHESKECEREADFFHRKERRAIGWTCCVTVVMLLVSGGWTSIYNWKRAKKAETALEEGLKPPPPPPNLGSLCNITSMQESEDAFLECENACKQASCCKKPKNDTDSCVSTSKDICEQYADCSVLKFDQDLPAAPSNLNLFCSPESLATKDGKIICGDVCNLGKCCKSTCKGHANCSGYDVCWGINTVILDGNVQQHCTLDKISSIDGRLQCEAVCQDRSCCYTEGEGNCYHENQEWCREYALCVFLQDLDGSDAYGGSAFIDNADTTGGDANATINGTEQQQQREEVERTCSPDNIARSEGRQDCEDLCESRVCCFAEDDTKCDDEWCSQYTPCQNLYNSSDAMTVSGEDRVADGITLMEEDVATLCSEEHVDTQSGLADCATICDTRKCCLLQQEEGADDGCPGHSMDKYCRGFDLCFIVPEREGDGRRLMESSEKKIESDNKLSYQSVLSSVCPGKTTLSLSEWTECAMLCEAMACCSSSGSCSRGGGRGWCEAYHICQEFMTQSEFSEQNKV